MRLPIVMMLLCVALNVGIDTYIYRALLHRCRHKWAAKVQLWSALVILLLIIIGICLPRRGGGDDMLLIIMWVLFAYFSIYIPKALFVVFDLVAKIPRLWHHHRLKWLSMTGAVISVAVFLLMWWGALINRFAIDVRHVTVEIPDLPMPFNGFTILQFSDLHTGSYGTSTSYVHKVVEKINSLHPDLILFTGDIVNRNSDELVPFVDELSRLSAPYGVYSILGNHDYGDYYNWPTPEDKKQNMLKLYSLQDQMHWHLLRNEHAWIHRDNDSIAIIGVENVGDPPFAVYGSLPASYPDLSDPNVKILLTHNPAHWTQEIADNPKANVALTLSGHTHAMQVSVGHFSPAAMRYRTWGGLYTDHSTRHSLYVNIGMGTVAIPMRLGATPELTLITLRPLTHERPAK